ncbi:hypothetical protein ARMGADRAFT_1039373 [Armillaria gallica]|uniref:Uncharacterized protein n=1 Tax=Armillaria gallica TaxID=47427 RepID=A0A2H3CED7_ARMGA|nr:hypothetical protein ARMGADRAFT_1039373 [Armillaria gallica]
MNRIGLVGNDSTSQMVLTRFTDVPGLFSHTALPSQRLRCRNLSSLISMLSVDLAGKFVVKVWQFDFLGSMIFIYESSATAVLWLWYLLKPMPRTGTTWPDLLLSTGAVLPMFLGCRAMYQFSGPITLGFMISAWVLAGMDTAWYKLVSSP